jgi:hypothetical protein
MIEESKWESKTVEHDTEQGFRTLDLDVGVPLFPRHNDVHHQERNGKNSSNNNLLKLKVLLGEDHVTEDEAGGDHVNDFQQKEASKDNGQGERDTVLVELVQVQFGHVVNDVVVADVE